MDVRGEPYQYGSLHPVFSQNLPEGFIRRYLYERLLRHAQVNDLYLLALQGSKGIGHLNYHSDISPSRHEQLTLSDILHWGGKGRLFEQLLERYYLNGQLSGVQPKVLVNINKKGAIPQESVIVKTFDAEFDLLTANEFICMSAAKYVGLEPPQFWISDDLQSFVIERFDHQAGEQLAFEDFTVLMGKSGDQKYHSSYETLLKAVAHYTKSEREVERAYRYIVFSCLVGNGDAHLKNFAVQYDKTRSNVVLCPPYDITHTLIYETLDNNMALKMANSKTFPDYRTLVQLGNNHRITQAKQCVDQIADSLNDFITYHLDPSLVPGLKASLQSSLTHACQTHSTLAAYRHDKKRKFT
jgi:serine/threonine-protein kinase HipA